jgi:hypothetical protein
MQIYCNYNTQRTAFFVEMYYRFHDGEIDLSFQRLVECSAMNDSKSKNHYWTPRDREPIPGEKRVGVDGIAKMWGISARRVLQLCKAGKVYAAKMVDGKWSIPKNAEKPVDGRRYRKTWLPPKNMMVLQYADHALIEAEKRHGGVEARREAIHRFTQDSAFHMHKAEISDLTYGDVREILAGRGVGGKSLKDHIAVLYHKRAIDFIRGAVVSRKMLSIDLIQQIHAIAMYGTPKATEKMKRLNYVTTMLRYVRDLETHPIHRAATFFTRFLFLWPFEKGNECTAYLTANFILMSLGYPPIVLYRAIFRWWRNYIDDHAPLDGTGKRFTKDFNQTDEEGDVMFTYDEAALRKPDKWDAHINSRLDATVFTSVFAKAVRRSCRLGFQRCVDWCRMNRAEE